jgi:hypothetical protein
MSGIPLGMSQPDLQRLAMPYKMTHEVCAILQALHVVLWCIREKASN